MAWQIEMQCSNNCNQCATNQVTTTTSDCYTCSHCHSHRLSCSHCYSQDNDNENDNKLAFNFQCNFNWNLILIDFPQHFLASLFQLSTLDWDFVPRLPAHEAISVASVCAAFAFAFFKRFSLTRGTWPIFVFVGFIYLFFYHSPLDLPYSISPTPLVYVFFADLSQFFFSIFGALYGRENDWNVIKNCTANAAANAFSKRSRSAACRMLHAADSRAPRVGIRWLQVF